VKALYVTGRSAIGDVRFERILRNLGENVIDDTLMVQLREKESADREILDWATRAREILGSRIPLFVNRRFDIAWSAGAGGVHLPSDGLPPPRVRANTPRGFRIGLSTHSPAEAAEAIEQGCDVVVLGPIFSTPSKEGLGTPLGPQALEELPAARGLGTEVFAIGGVTEENLERLLPWADRLAGVAGIRLFQEAADPAAVVERLAAR
jgi:thiamine-phosphate pyrophosphorylase